MMKFNVETKIRQLFSFGLDGTQDIISARRISLVNLGTFANFICLLGFGIYLFLINVYTGSAICIGGSLLNLLAFHLNGGNHKILGYFTMSLANLAVYDSLGLFYGRSSGISFLLFLWLITVIFLVDKPKTYLPLVLAGAISFLGLEYFYQNHTPLLEIPANIHTIYFLVVSVCLGYLLILMEFIKKIHTDYQNSVKQQNVQLLKYFTAIEQTHAIVVITDTEGKIEYANPQFEKITGYTTGEVMGQTPRILKSGKTPPEVYKEMWKQIKRGQVWQGELVNVSKFGEEFIERVIISPIITKNGEIINFIAVIENVTELKKTEVSLQESKEQLAKLLENQTVKSNLLRTRLDYIYNNANNAVAFFEIEGDIIRFASCNKMWANSLGYEPETLEGLEVYKTCSTETFKLYQSFIFKALEAKTSIQDYVLWENKCLHVVVIPVVSDGLDKIKTVASFVYNITEKYEADIKLRESERNFKTIFNSSTDAILVCKSDFSVLEVNDRYFQITGIRLPIGKIPDKEIKKYIPEKYHVQIFQRIQQLKQDEVISSFECELFSSNGKLIPVELNSSLFNYNGETAILCIIRDISARKILEKQLVQIGVQVESRERQQLAADLHDNVGPLLSSMNMYLSTVFLNPEIKKHSPAFADVKRILKETISAVREISTNISPHVLTNYGLSAAIQVFFETKHKLIEIRIDDQLGEFRFSDTQEIMVYNIIKEMFNNTIKYACASSIYLFMGKEDKFIHVRYSDNGVGFNFDEKLGSINQSIGLFSMINRIKYLDGTYQIQTSPGTGFKLELTFPYTIE